MQMEQEVFTFRRFKVFHSASAMKVGTDAVLLGAWTTVGDATRILDIGTGCGIIALMLAQRSAARVDAIDIDKDSITESRKNFMLSPWKNRIRAIHMPLAQYREKTAFAYDLIVSNPPFFQNSLLPEGDKLKFAKHSVTLSYGELIEHAAALLTQEGRLAVILPFDSSQTFTEQALQKGLHVIEQLLIYPTPAKEPNRIILVFSRLGRREKHFSELVVRNKDGTYSQAYKQLTAGFHPAGILK